MTFTISFVTLQLSLLLTSFVRIIIYEDKYIDLMIYNKF